MSGHSKWSKVKHQKATVDVVRGQAFTKASHAITIAVAAAGGVTDPAMNSRLRLAIEKARELNMPKDRIERAIAKGKGEGGDTRESVWYEGYGPGGVAFLVESATDNRLRTASAIKHIFDRFGGTLAGPGAVSFLFTKKADGEFIVRPYSGVTPDEENRQKAHKLEEELRVLPDVQRIYTNLP
ncbi:YebC/PmpR family DNA-binding transcriptional regulator [Candidatus Gottesmanbacteria bacterium]|nr:YebC/PmpR family DNA-binding transcriptional regulator [Candidatus Gottesmanbacteria bacterium]